MGLRGVYDAVAKAATPLVEAAFHSGQAGEVSRAVNQLQRMVTAQMEGINETVLHMANRPSASDVRELRRQIGDLDYELRQLRAELAARDAELVAWQKAAGRSGSTRGASSRSRKGPGDA